MNWTLAKTELNMGRLEKQTRLTLLMMVASHSLASVRNMFNLDWQTAKLNLSRLLVWVMITSSVKGNQVICWWLLVLCTMLQVSTTSLTLDK